MLHCLTFIIAIWLFWANPAEAAVWFSGGMDLEKTLSAPKVNVVGHEAPTEELNIFYAARGYKPAWDFSGSHNTATLNTFLDSLEKLITYHGLVRSNYAIDAIRTMDTTHLENQIKLELSVTDTLLHLAHDLHGDSVDLNTLYPGWVFYRSEIDIPSLLAAAVNTNSLNDFIQSLTPKNPSYEQLAQGLETYRAMAVAGAWPLISSGPTLRPNDTHPRIAQLRARLAAENYLPSTTTLLDPNLYDMELKIAVEAYQLRNGLETDGLIGKKVLEALNTPIEKRIEQIMANMERWRHMPDDFPPQRYALVNIPNASIVINEDGKDVYRGNVIVGRVDRKTPFISSAIRSMIVNPSWHVPSKIARKDILPKLREDPHYLEKLGFTIRGSEDDPHGENIDWVSMQEKEFNFRLRQAPGDQNSLGRLKFDFDNEFAVYIHGTPHQELFQKNERALSSGCIRLHDPEQVAELLLAHNKSRWDAERISNEISSNKTHWVPIDQPMPLYILYWTVFMDENKQINFRKDVYDYDTFLMQNMTGSDIPTKQVSEKH
ncbi:MAG: L,D-transpeptidase family protein [Alphaproteobacteria bacterium]